MRVSLELTYPQGEMHKMKDEYKVPFPLFTGGYGCGKSEILAINAVRDVMLFPGCRVGIYAPTLDLLDLNLVPRIQHRLDQLGINYHMNTAKHRLMIRGGREIIFRSMNDPGRIVAYEVYASHVDEADLMINIKKATDAWDRIIARNRQKWENLDGTLHPKHFNMVSAYSTPEGYKFTYKRWSKKPGEGYRYVQAPTSSNWTLDEAYIKNLKDTYTPEQCKAYLLGEWTNIFNGSVYTYFNKKKLSTNKVISRGDILLAGADFNYGGSCVSIYTGITEWDRLSKEERESLTSKASIRKAMNTQIGLRMIDECTVHDTEQMVEVLTNDYSKNRVIIYPDATGDSNSSNASESDIAMLKLARFQIKANPSNPRIVDRVNSLQRLMYNGLFEINPDTCPKSVESLQEHAYSERTNLPEKFSGPATIDDRNDAAGYPSAFMFPIKKIITTRTDF